MAFKLYNSKLRLLALEGISYKIYYQSTKYLSSITCLQRCQHSSPKNSKSSFKTVSERKWIHLQSSLHSKVIPFLLSDIGEGIVEVEVKEWFIKPGDRVAQFDPICEVQSDKASVTITSRYDGFVNQVHYEVGSIAKVGSSLLDIEIDDGNLEKNEERELSASVNQKTTEEFTPSSHEDARTFGRKALAAPAVRRIAKENNVDLNLIEGTGKDGRILKEDILLYLENQQPGRSEIKPETVETPTDEFPVDRIEAITGFRKAMAKTMTNAWTVPHFSYCDEVEVNELAKLKNELGKISRSNNVKITYMPFFIKAASLALKKYPVLNSHVDEKCENVTIKRSHNIGIAMDTPNGLVVPNVKNVRKLSVVEIARELNRLRNLGEKGQLKMADLKDGTFTLSNIGAIGGTYAKPVIFAPQVVIGALGKIQVLPRFDEHKNLVESHIFNVSWSADHRIIDGATLARFSNLWKLYLESPRLLLQL